MIKLSGYFYLIKHLHLHLSKVIFLEVAEFNVLEYARQRLI